MTGEILDKFSQLITTALGLVAALAWNTAIQNLFDKVFGEAGGKLAGQFLYATLITIVVIFATLSVSRAAERGQRGPRRNEPEDFSAAPGSRCSG